MTATIQIGNSDDKLKQHEWSSFCLEVQYAIERNFSQVHFRGCSESDAPWQNACWVIESTDESLKFLEACLTEIRTKYRQESVAITVGETRFI